MSGARIRVRVEVAEEIVACVAQLREHRASDRRSRVSSERRRRRARGVERLQAADAAVRRDVLAGEAEGLPELTSALAEIDASLADETVEAAALEARLDVLEERIDDARDAAAAQELQLERLVGMLPPGLSAGSPDSARRDRDGALHLTLTRDDGRGRLPLEVLGGPSGLELMVDPARAGFDRVRTGKGTLVGCDAEWAATEMLANHLRAQGERVQLIGTERPRARRRVERRRTAGT